MLNVEIEILDPTLNEEERVLDQRTMVVIYRVKCRVKIQSRYLSNILYIKSVYMLSIITLDVIVEGSTTCTSKKLARTIPRRTPKNSKCQNTRNLDENYPTS